MGKFNRICDRLVGNVGPFGRMPTYILGEPFCQKNGQTILTIINENIFLVTFAQLDLVRQSASRAEDEVHLHWYPRSFRPVSTRATAAE